MRPTKSISLAFPLLPFSADCSRLRQTDVKAGHYERKVQALEQARDEWEAKYEEMAKKHADLQKELQELEQSMGNI